MKIYCVNPNLPIQLQIKHLINGMVNKKVFRSVKNEVQQVHLKG